MDKQSRAEQSARSFFHEHQAGKKGAKNRFKNFRLIGFSPLIFFAKVQEIRDKLQGYTGFRQQFPRLRGSILAENLA
jgi:hypothetical protein